MPGYGLSVKAEEDIGAIARYTIDRFGIEQARKYRDSMIRCFEALAATPGMGRAVPRSREGYRRFAHKSHVIFYRKGNKGIFIVRVLHEMMDPRRHL